MKLQEGTSVQMNSRGKFWKMLVNKKGMYILEASIIMPLFIASMVMMISIIPVITACENVVFSASDELRLDSAKAAFIDDGILSPAAIYGRVTSENSRISTFSIDSYRQGVTRNGIDELITVKFTAGFRNGISLIPVNGIKFSGNLTSRAFTGSTHTVESDSDDSIVYVFPEDGVRFHNLGCRYLHAHCHMTVLTQSLMNRYHPCPLCGARNAHLGETVICFERAGEAYHTQGCRQVEREKYYTETTKSSAERAGYTACSVCGG